MAGCLYLKPIVHRPDNALPSIVDPAGPEPEGGFPRSLSGVTNIIKVVAVDPDRDTMDISWTLSTIDTNPYEKLKVVNDNSTTFTIKLPRDAELDGRLLQATVFDPFGGQRTIRFALEVP